MQYSLHILNPYPSRQAMGNLEKFEETKGVIRSCRSKKDRQHNGQQTKGSTMIYKTLHIKLKIERHEMPQITGCELG